MITVACCWVKGNVPYTAEYVTTLRAMVYRHLQRPFRFVCLTDQAKALPRDLETIPIMLPKGLFGWWAKMELFNPAHNLGPRVMYLDLDTVVVSALDPIVDHPASFALVPDGGSFQPKTGHRVVKRFNSSVMVWNESATRLVDKAWTPELAKTYWGDQDVLGDVCPWAAQMPREWFPRLSELHGEKPGPDAKVVLCKVPKNHIAAKAVPWIREAWRAA